MLDRHVAYLDGVAINIRLKHQKAISRAEIIRALIEAALTRRDVDLSDADSTAAVARLLLGKSLPRRKVRR